MGSATVASEYSLADVLERIYQNQLALEAAVMEVTLWAERQNAAERAIKPFVIGRKAWLFSDTPKGADASAQIYSLVETAKANGQEPYTWLRHVLDRLPHASSVEDYEALLPWNCSPEMPR
ncbi:Mobile element protein [Pseudomonas batumici]|uniref:Mobile element protein n=1 Tax=Pseudomonas batumici TaxID=226910 RepID=A0A0C2I7T8_9PSED|nr:transposase domain-containing protein [Pseudomonas batumici]KIH82985.1 Mobile element protein [Pseudomonas batumici]